MSGEPLGMDSGIPARRLSPKEHLRRAAESQLGSEAERYHLGAATAEALVRIESHLSGLAASASVAVLRIESHLRREGGG